MAVIGCLMNLGHFRGWRYESSDANGRQALALWFSNRMGCPWLAFDDDNNAWKPWKL